MRSIFLVPENRAIDPIYLTVDGKFLGDDENAEIEKLALKVFAIDKDAKIVAICAIDFKNQISTIMEFEREIVISRTDY